MVSSSTGNPKEGLILERNDLSDPESNRYEEPKKRNRITWTMDLHEKFLEAVEALGGNEYATPEGILHLMNIKGLTAKHIGSHLQKHRLRHRTAKQGGQRQENATRIPITDLIISAHDGATSRSTTSRVETDGEVHPLRMWTEGKKRSASENHREDTESVCVWDKYENNLNRVFSENKKRWLFMSEHRWLGKNNVVITDEGDTYKASETAGGASIEAYRANLGASGSGSLLTSDQVRQNGYAEATRDNDNMGTINLPQGYGASVENTGSSSLLTSDQVRQNNLTESARNNDTVGNNNLLEGIMDFTIDWAHLESTCLDLTGPSDVWEEADSFLMNQPESLGLEDPLQVGDTTSNDALRSAGLINVDEPVTQGSQMQQSLGMEDLQQVDDIPWNDAPTTEAEAAVGGSQYQQSLAPEVLQAGDVAWDDDLRSPGTANFLDEAIMGNALIDDAVGPIALDDELWA